IIIIIIIIIVIIIICFMLKKKKKRLDNNIIKLVYINAFYHSYCFEQIKKAKSKTHHHFGKQQTNETNYYHEHNPNEQKTFDHFILDQRTKEGRITTRWLKWIVEKQDEVSLESLCDFMVKLSHTFIDSYQLSKFYFVYFLSQYYECVRIFVYRCVLGQGSTQTMVSNILASQFQDLSGLDETYRRKTFWMRTLKHDKLQINKEYWLEPAVDIGHHNLLTVSSDSTPKRHSQLPFQAGESVPFAEAINIIGELEKQDDIHASPDIGINLILEAVKLVNDVAMRYFENNKRSQGIEKPKLVPLGNDDLFPLVVYCVIQSRLENPHVCIRFIELILPEENTTMGQAAFSLSLLKAAVQYIINAAPEEFGLDADVDADHMA
ncbi:hypothetical protein RFI_17884, partial [Reticulomyxa filosa]